MPEAEPPRCRNLEIKVRCPDLVAAGAACVRLGARREGIQLQTDVYFQVPNGRLKLRRIEGQPAVLIWYDRPNQAGTRASDYYLAPVSDPALMEATLAAALAERGRVCKRREIFHFYNVRIHLDEVERLGSFLELEAVVSGDNGDAISLQRLEQLGAVLGLSGAERLAGSYADLLGL